MRTDPNRRRLARRFATFTPILRDDNRWISRVAIMLGSNDLKGALVSAPTTLPAASASAKTAAPGRGRPHAGAAQGAGDLPAADPGDLRRLRRLCRNVRWRRAKSLRRPFYEAVAKEAGAAFLDAER